MRAGRSGLLLALLAAGCGRIGYDRVQLVDAPEDARVDAPALDAPVDRPPEGTADAPAADAPAVDLRADAPGDPPPATPDPSVTATAGRQAGTLFTDTCPAGQVLNGFEGLVDLSNGTYYPNLVGRCGPIQLSSGPPYRVTAVPFRDLLPARGTGLTTFAYTCPAGQSVIGLDGRLGVEITALVIVCADLVVTGGPPSYQIVPGSGRHREPLMNVAGGSPFSLACPTGQLARGTHFWAGPWIFAVGLACQTVSVRP